MKILNYILFTIIILIPFRIVAQTPVQIKGVINKYTDVTSFDGNSAVYVTSAVNFQQGDTVMLAQMRGAIYSPDDPNLIDLPGYTGKYELTVLGPISGNRISFNSPLKNSYNETEAIQLIRVPSYKDARVTEKLTCDDWDGKKGGVLVLVATNSLTLEADIDVSGKGFGGKNPVQYAVGKCFASGSVPFHVLNASSDSTSGIKGDGIVTKQFVYTRGYGTFGNGGGAGFGAFSGGGGGGNYGIGGKGAKESCASDEDPNWGGGGARIESQYFSNDLFHRRIFMGGGGGSGIEKSLNSGSAGGHGGGIVIILTPYLISNNHYIKADGVDVTKLITDGSSSGGGGGGGMVLLAIDSVKNKILNVSATGGDGGGAASGSPCEGQGGGGGGGFVWFAGKSIDFANLDISGGKVGFGTCDVSATSGSKGDSLNRLLLPLTGFLNNTIVSVSKTCYSTSVKISGSQPQGGNGVYTYLWEYRPYRTTDWFSAPGINNKINYVTGFLTDTAEFRRTVSSDGMNDVSRSIRIDVFPQITNNIVEPDTVLCNGAASVIIRGKIATGGKGNFTYEWSRRTLSGSWEAATGVINGTDYSVASDLTRFYRRKATSDYCSTYDSVKVEVLPVITNNIVAPRQTICSGAIPAPFNGNAPGGGTGAYKYKWQRSSDSLSWTNTTITTQNLANPVALTQTTYYRRVVMSGLNDCCHDTSNNIKIIVLPQIANNTITASQTICQGTKPALFSGSSPGGGDVSTGYRYKWESSKKAPKWDSLQYSPLIKDFQALEQDTTQSFRRVVFSGLNDCCKSISNEIKVTVQPKIKNNTIAGDTAICDNTVPALVRSVFSSFTGGDGINYGFQWMRKPPSGTWQNIAGANQLTFQPSALTDTVWYQRVITSGTCTDISNTVKIDVLNTIQGNQITGVDVVCESYPAGNITSGALTGGEPNVYRVSWERSPDQTNWELIPGENNAQLAPGILPQITSFRRKVKSGPNDCCISISNSFLISVDKKPEIPEAGVNKDLIFQDTTSLVATIPVVGSGVWTSTSDADILNPANYNTKIAGLKFNRYVFYWTVTNGVCPSVTDSVIVNVSDLKRFTGFSPNNDGVNDYFIVDGLTNAPEKELTVFNRWGVEVYNSPNYQNDWGGKNKNGEDLPEDTYYYILKVKNIFDAGRDRPISGFVVIKR